MVKLTRAASVLGRGASTLSVPRPEERSKARYRNEAWRAWYGLKEWRDLKKAVYLRDGMQCQQTGVLLTRTPNRTNSAIVDHVEPHRGDWAKFTNIDNLQLVSKAWHDAEKQRQERAMPIGVDMGGVGRK